MPDLPSFPYDPIRRLAARAHRGCASPARPRATPVVGAGLLLVLAACGPAGAPERSGAAEPPAPVGADAAQARARNPRIETIVAGVSAANLRRHVEALAAIPSRHIESPHIERAWTYLRDEFEKIPHLEVELDEFTSPVGRLGSREVRMVNVVATLRGRTDPERMYVVSGHYDSRASDGRDASTRAPGAVDDASGTAMALELARVFAGHELEATVVFIAFSGEEQGLYGSDHWAETAAARGWNVDAMITNDIVGNSEGGGGHTSDRDLRVFSEGVPETETERQARLRRSIGGEVDSPARQLARSVQEIGERYVPEMRVHLIYRRDRFGRGGDHTPFSRRGYPAVRLTEMYENYERQHQDVRVEDGVQYGDLPEFFDEEYAARICKVNAAVLATLASAPPPPQNVRIGGAVRYDTTLAWDPVEAPDLAGYRILVRDTSSPVWERSVDVGRVDRHVLEGEIVDNAFFAVQSVDREGNASRPVFPTGFARGR